MRVHFTLNTNKSSKPESITFLSPRLDKVSQIVVPLAQDGDDNYIGQSMSMAFPPNKEQIRVIRALEGVLTYERPIDEVLQELIKDMGRQVVWDEALDKYRNVSTMKDGESTYTADGTEISVFADSEEKAVRRLADKITAAMTTNPEKAAELAQWFAAKRPVSEVESGKCPEVAPLSLLGGCFAEEEEKKAPAKKAPVKKPRIRKNS